MLELDQVYERAAEFDVIHFHVDYLHYALSRRLGVPHVTTLHGRLDLPDLQPLYREFCDVPVVSISDAQRAPVAFAKWIETVHHGLPEELHQAGYEPGSYFAFLGRISPEKRVDRAIEIAKRLGVPLKVGAKVDAADDQYFHREIEPLFDDPIVEFLGEIGEADKGDLLRGARALLFPIDWPEPFGLVMIEAFACGTPVVAFRGGSVAEVVEDGVTGFVVDDLDAAVEAARNVHQLDRRRIRREFERRFSAQRMATRYLRVYGEVALLSRAAAQHGISLETAELALGSGAGNGASNGRPRARA
jgi:glycosyltransferase involved in cell wall biosynthesis